MSNKTGKKVQILQVCPMNAAYLLGRRHNVSDLARKLGKSEVVLANKLNPHQEFHMLSLSEAVAITELSNDNAIVEAWCHQRGGVFVQLPETAGCDEELADKLMLINSKLGEAMQSVHTARSDGVIDEVEFERIRAGVMSTISELLSIKSLIKGQVRDVPIKTHQVISK